MTHHINSVYGNRLGATDGDIGHVKDFYFDDRRWQVRYVVADTGSWLPRRQVLLSPHAFGPLEQQEKILLINLSRRQIEDSPPIDSHRPVSRQYEAEYFHYYGWPVYWVGDVSEGLAGSLASFPRGLNRSRAKTATTRPRTLIFAARGPSRVTKYMRWTARLVTSATLQWMKKPGHP